MKNKIIMLFFLLITSFSYAQEKHNGFVISDITTTKFDTTKINIYALVVRYEGKIVSFRPFDYGLKYDWSGVDIKIDPNDIDAIDARILLDHYGFVLNQYRELLMHVTVKRTGIIYDKYIGGYMYKEIYELPDFLDVQLEVLTIK